MRSIPFTRPQPVQVATCGGAASTPSSAAGTRANDDFNALVRKAEATVAAARTAPDPTPDEVVFRAFKADGWDAITGDQGLGSLALCAVLALRDAGFDL